jgi:hypothetical protein
VGGLTSLPPHGAFFIHHFFSVFKNRDFLRKRGFTTSTSLWISGNPQFNFRVGRTRSIRYNGQVKELDESSAGDVSMMGSADRLVTELNRLGVHFVTGGELEWSAPSLPPAELLAGLAAQSEARLRLALIPLLLVHPELATTLPEALARLSEQEQLTLKLFYTAAVILQQCHAEQLRALLGRYDPLPDHFATELGIPTVGDCLDRLKHLGERHQALSGLAINWVGTYRHAVDRLLRQLSLEVQWSR